MKISAKQLVRELDPDDTPPIVYSFGGGKGKFRESRNPYQNYPLIIYDADVIAEDRVIDDATIMGG